MEEEMQQTTHEGKGRSETKEEVWNVAMVVVMLLIVAMIVVLRHTLSFSNKRKLEPNTHRKDGFYDF
jgi:hypothetical protein